MNTLEQEIITKFQQLDSHARQRVLSVIGQETESRLKQESFDYAGWWASVDTLQADIRSRIGDTGTVGSLSLLDELREESS